MERNYTMTLTPETPISRLWIWRGHRRFKLIAALIGTLTLGVLLLEQIDRILKGLKND